LAVAIRTTEGAKVAVDLVRTCDVVVQGFRPGALTKVGLGAEALRAENPRLIYASLSGFGAEGPGPARRGIDMVAQAESGMAALLGMVIRRMGLVDAAAGISIGQAVLAALFQRERTGLGAEIEVSLYDTALWLQMQQIAEYTATGMAPISPNEYAAQEPLMGLYDVGGGQVYLAIRSQKDWLQFASVVGGTHLLSDPRFVDPEARRQHVEQLQAEVTSLLETIDRDELCKLCLEHGLMASPIRDYAEVLDDPQAVANRSFQVVDSGDGIAVTQVRAPYRFRSSPDPVLRRAPRVGEHSREILQELGYPEERIREFVKSGIVSEAE
jgi:crotonobetainyl-CoA:carnitine CoA-transferase CaiB-like acyl-CoA transferase